ncbi:MAG: oligopeptide transport system substrate-binding protein [Ulvibacter sp.]|jgi:oligopeptide transport system substrate-binding protein
MHNNFKIKAFAKFPFFAVLFVFILASCVEKSDNIVDASNKKYGGVYRINFDDTKPFTFFPPQAKISGSIDMIEVAYETLLKFNNDGSAIEGYLAKSWEINEAGDEYTIHLNENIYFHDDPCFKDGLGRELISDDVAFCLTQLCTPGKMNSNSRLISEQIVGGMERIESQEETFSSQYLKGINIIDDYTLQIKLVGPSYSFNNYLTHYATSIYPKEALIHYGPLMRGNMVGTGPFQLKTRIPGKTAIFIRNNKYWMEDDEGNPLPYLDGVKVTFESNHSEVLSIANKNMLDLMINPSRAIQKHLNITNDTSITSTGFYKSEYPAFDIQYLGFLLTDSNYMDLRVRKAFNLAIDRKFIVDSVLSERADIANYGIIPRTFTEYEIKEGHKYDPELARQLMIEAGYNANNKFPRQTLHITTSEDGLLVAGAVQSMLFKNLGVSIDLSALDTDNHYEKYEEGRFPLAADRWAADYYDADNFLNLYVSYLTPEQGGQNLGHFDNQEFDSLFQKGLTEFDSEERLSLFADANTILYENSAFIPIYSSKTMVIMSTRTRGLTNPNVNKLPLKTIYIKK